MSPDGGHTGGATSPGLDNGYPAQKARAGAAEVADSTMVNAGAAAEAAETGPTRTKMDQLE